MMPCGATVLAKKPRRLALLIVHRDLSLSGEGHSLVERQRGHASLLVTLAPTVLAAWVIRPALCPRDARDALAVRPITRR